MKNFLEFSKKKTIDENTLKTIQQMFPNNQEINRLINDFNEINNPSEQKKTKRNKSAIKSNRTYTSFEKNKKDSSIWDNYKLNNNNNKLNYNNNIDKNKYKNEIIQNNKYNYRPKSTTNNIIDNSTSNTNQKNSFILKDYNNNFNNFKTNYNYNINLNHSNTNNHLNKEEIYAKYNIQIPNNNIKLSDFDLSNNSINSNFSSDKFTQYKNKLNKEYLDILAREKEKVEERERKLEQINIDNPQRKILEEQYKKENAQSQIYLMNKKKEIDKKINEYKKEFKSGD